MSCRIAVLVEGATEQALLPALRRFLEPHLAGRMPKLAVRVFEGRVPKERTLQRWVQLLLSHGNDHVIALADVYTGTEDFSDAADAKAKMRRWVGKEPRFHPHVALHEFEAWLLPYSASIATQARNDRVKPWPHPEQVNHGKPPSEHLQDIFRTGKRSRTYVKTRDARSILEGADLAVAAQACPELKSFLNTIVKLAGGDPLPTGAVTLPAATSPPPGQNRSARRRRPPA